MNLCDICLDEVDKLSKLTDEFGGYDVCYRCKKDLEDRIDIINKQVSVREIELRKQAYMQWYDKNFKEEEENILSPVEVFNALMQIILQRQNKRG